jgi:hypothetical protein
MKLRTIIDEVKRTKCVPETLGDLNNLDLKRVGQLIGAFAPQGMFREFETLRNSLEEVLRQR